MQPEKNSDVSGKYKNVSGKVIAGFATLPALAAISIMGLGQNDQRNTGTEYLQKTAAADAEHRERYEQSIEDAINAQYDKEALLDYISVEQDGSLGAAGLALIESVLKDDYKDIAGRIETPLMDSAAKYIPQPGEKFAVVSVDINPEADNGDEYIVVRPDHILHDPEDGIPVVQTH